jgi:signal transduction histidine kinase
MACSRTALLSLLLCLGFADCRPTARMADETAWYDAEAQWKRGDPTAYHAWRALDPALPRGRAAWAHLREADARYRRAVDLLRADQQGLRETLGEALALAPMNPELYLPFARACRERGSLWRAADFYRKYLVRNPSSPESAQARAELAELGGDRDPFPPEFEEPARSGTTASGGARGWTPILLATSAAVLALATTLVMLRRRRAVSLAEILLERPEVQKTVAYQIGCLRHEFLKHRIGTAGEALTAWMAGQASPEQRHFLEERLCKGEPLLGAWRVHVAGIERSLGIGPSLTRGDPLFRQAHCALVVLNRAARATKPTDARPVQAALGSLRRLDRELAELVTRLAYCPLDEAFLREVLASTRSEWSSGKVDLDEIVVAAATDAVAVDVYRTDMRIVLKNIFRNAIAALAQTPPPRRLAVDVLVELEPTGEEVVRIRVRDSSHGHIELPDDGNGANGVEHGLGIVHTALLRYDGSLEVVPADGGYAKAVVVRLFRSQGPLPLGEGA